MLELCPLIKNAKLSLLRDLHFGLVDLVGRTASLGLFVAMLAGDGIMLAARVLTLPNLSFLTSLMRLIHAMTALLLK